METEAGDVAGGEEGLFCCAETGFRFGVKRVGWQEGICLACFDVCDEALLGSGVRNWASSTAPSGLLVVT